MYNPCAVEGPGPREHSDPFSVHLLVEQREFCRGDLALEGLALPKQLSDFINALYKLIGSL